MRKTIHLLIVSTLLATVIFSSMPVQAALATSGGQPTLAIPAVPTLISPKGTIGDTHPPYQWSASTGATGYRIAVYSIASTSYIILLNVSTSYCTASVCTYHPATVLAKGDYRWKVLAKNSSGVSAYSPFSSFTVGIPPIPTPLLPDLIAYTDRPEYMWQASSGATSYRLAVYDTVTHTYVVLTYVSSSICMDGTCYYSPDVALVDGRAYNWKVLAKNALGVSAYSDWMGFTVLKMYDRP
jgi:hypothetical protein